VERAKYSSVKMHLLMLTRVYSLILTSFPLYGTRFIIQEKNPHAHTTYTLIHIRIIIILLVVSCYIIIYAIVVFVLVIDTQSLAKSIITIISTVHTKAQVSIWKRCNYKGQRSKLYTTLLLSNIYYRFGLNKQTFFLPRD
jgi:hypothetical protein